MVFSLPSRQSSTTPSLSLRRPHVYHHLRSISEVRIFELRSNLLQVRSRLLKISAKALFVPKILEFHKMWTNYWQQCCLKTRHICFAYPLQQLKRPQSLQVNPLILDQYQSLASTEKKLGGTNRHRNSRRDDYLYRGNIAKLFQCHRCWLHPCDNL